MRIIFDPRYYGKGRVYHNPTVESILNRFEICKEFYSDNEELRYIMLVSEEN